MKSFQKILLTFLLSSGCLFIACDVIDGCSCPSIDGEFFDITGLEVIPQASGIGDVPAGTALNFADFDSFHFDYIVEYVAEQKEYFQPSRWHNAAWACSCIYNGIFGSKDEIFSEIKITTMNDYNDTFSAGESINDILLLNYFGTEMRLSEYLEENEGELIETEDLFMSLTTPPTIDKEVILNVRMEFTNGEIYEVETVPIILN